MALIQSLNNIPWTFEYLCKKKKSMKFIGQIENQVSDYSCSWESLV
jgi:hypothetical protein